MIIIKRYPNRKLYNTENSQYITLDEIGELVKQNIDLKVVDNKTQEDITNIIMAQVVLNIERKERNSSTIKDSIKDLISNSGGYINKTKTTIKQEVERLLKRGEEEIETISKKIDEKVRDSINSIFIVNLVKDILSMKEKMELMEDDINSLRNEVKYLKNEINDLKRKK
ncbi:polyhydroxyalkanoate synthesis regulator DNA-binding domain-containing protein [bacterium]|nr:polyhydroxyalkanoate synthesis regulator DNA-binding domain-containing protein [bacterium]